MPRFEPFQALRYGSNVELNEVCSPPYDVLSDADRLALANKHENNIVHIDMPLAPSGNAYEHAASVLTQWIGNSVMVRDEVPSFTLYRMQFTDSTGKPRNVVGVIGALEVVDEGAGGVLPHERTTPKAKTDRLELTRATDANLSPVWGLSLASGLSKLLSEPGEHLGSVIDDLGVIHSVERVADGARIAAISTAISSHPVVIADGHHRYAISRTYRDETRDRLNSKTSGAELTMTYVNELIDEQLSVAAIHRLYEGISYKELAAALSPFFTITDADPVGPTTLSQMNERNSLCLVAKTGRTHWLTPIAEKFAGVRNLDSAYLEHALSNVQHEVRYQHGVTEIQHELQTSDATAAILIRPVSVAEIQRTANEGLLMPPKSTFFTPKLRTGFVLREMKTR
uniref:Uncharacterized conserved protein COG4198 n=1 Tax=uncultured Actinomycetes bacterium TaxID=152507 RepID=D0U614_9ACTN|nr:uncharacterized conserved protein COG4198 [uncultured Actinomycetes bacterium]